MAVDADPVVFLLLSKSQSALGIEDALESAVIPRGEVVARLSPTTQESVS